VSSPVDVLLAGADAVLRGRMAGVLRRSAHTVVEVESAAAAVEAVQQGCAPRLLVLDLEGASRAERSTFATLRQAPGCAGAPLLVLSRVGNDEAPGLSPDVSLLKPVDAAELVEELDIVRRERDRVQAELDQSGGIIDVGNGEPENLDARAEWIADSLIELGERLSAAEPAVLR